MSEQLTWFKSSYSDSEGDACVEIALTWFKSSHSDGEGGACVEVAFPAPRLTAVHVRDSKNTEGPQLALSPTTWTEFVTYAAARA